MKKKVLSLLLSCSMVFGMTACQDKAEVDESAESTVKEIVSEAAESAESKVDAVIENITDATGVLDQIADTDIVDVVDKALDGDVEGIIEKFTESPDETMVSDKLQAVADKITEYFENIEKGNEELYENELDGEIKQGAELKLTLIPGEAFVEETGVEELKSMSATIDMDIKDPMHNRFYGSVQLNDDELVKVELIQDEMVLYVGVPEYTDQYLKIDIEELAGIDKGTVRKFLEEGTGSMLSFKDIKKMWDDHSAEFIETFKYQEKVADYTIGFEDYEITGDRFVTKADIQDAMKVILGIAEDLSIYPAYGINLEDLAEDMKDAEGYISLNYIHNDKDEFAWEIIAVDTSDDDEDSESIVFVSTEKGICLYSVDQWGDKERFLYTVKESDEKGQIILESYGDAVMTIQYDNLREGHVELSSVPSEDTDVNFTFVFDQDGDDLTINLVAGDEYETVKVEFKGNQEKAYLSLIAAEDGKELMELRIDSEAKDFDDFENPGNAVDVDKVDQWLTSFDEQKLLNTLLTLQQKYPNIIGNVAGMIPDQE